MSEKDIFQKIEKISESADILGMTGSPSSAKEAGLDIREISQSSRILGQMVYFLNIEENVNIISIGQVTKIETRNRFHEMDVMRSVIKRRGKLPHLTENSDIRLATLAIQSNFNLKDPEAYMLGNSPSTGKEVKKVQNELIEELMKYLGYHTYLTSIGRIYGTNVDVPLWFKQFKPSDDGRINSQGSLFTGIFGQTGSGKTTAAAMMILGYLKNRNMNILILDTQGQFTSDNNILPNNDPTFRQYILNNNEYNILQQQVPEMNLTSTNNKYINLNVLNDLVFDLEDYDILEELLITEEFVSNLINIRLTERQEGTAKAITDYIQSRARHVEGFNWTQNRGNNDLLIQMMKALGSVNRDGDYIDDDPQGERLRSIIYTAQAEKTRVRNTIRDNLLELEANPRGHILRTSWNRVAERFSMSGGKINITNLSEILLRNNGNIIILDPTIPAQNRMSVKQDDLIASVIAALQKKLDIQSQELIINNELANCLIVMDEAHRYVSSNAETDKRKDLARQLITAVRTLRKVGIGYMFISQTISSIDEEVIKQLRIKAFGFGLTESDEIRAIRNNIADENAVDFYRQFIDPEASKKFPFMLTGPVSPLTATGSPIFIETYNNIKDFK